MVLSCLYQYYHSLDPGTWHILLGLLCCRSLALNILVYAVTICACIYIVCAYVCVYMCTLQYIYIHVCVYTRVYTYSYLWWFIFKANLFKSYPY